MSGANATGNIDGGKATGRSGVARAGRAAGTQTSVAGRPTNMGRASSAGAQCSDVISSIYTSDSRELASLGGVERCSWKSATDFELQLASYLWLVFLARYANL